MTKEEIIAYGKNYYRDLTMACCEIDKKHKEFVRMAIKALSQEPCDDTEIKKIDEWEIKGKNVEVWLVKGKLQVRYLGTIHNIPLPPVKPQEPCDKCVYSTKDGYCQYDDITETIPPLDPCDDCIFEEGSKYCIEHCPHEAKER